MALEIFGRGKSSAANGQSRADRQYVQFHPDVSLPVERPLLKHQLDKIDRLLAGHWCRRQRQGREEVERRPQVPQLEEQRHRAVHQRSKHRGAGSARGASGHEGEPPRVEELLDTWSVAPLFSRYNKASTFKDFEQLQRQARSQRYSVIKNPHGNPQTLKDTIRKLKVSQGCRTGSRTWTSSPTSWWGWCRS